MCSSTGTGNGDKDQADGVAALGIRPLVTKTVMESLEDRENLARDVLALAKGLGA